MVKKRIITGKVNKKMSKLTNVRPILQKDNGIKNRERASSELIPRTLSGKTVSLADSEFLHNKI